MHPPLRSMRCAHAEAKPRHDSLDANGLVAGTNIRTENSNECSVFDNASRSCIG